MSRKVKVPAENRTAASVPPRITVSQAKYLTCTDSFDDMLDALGLSGILVPLSVSVSDSFALQDTRTVTIGFSLAANDSLTLTDRLTISLAVGISDSFTLSDSLDVRYGYGLATSDNFTLTDGLSSTSIGHLALAVSDSNTLTDSLAIGYGLGPADAITLTDSLTTFGQIFLIIGESIYNWDEFIAPVPQGINFSIQREDFLSQSDSIQLFSAGFMTQADSIDNLLDAYLARSVGFLPLADSLSQFDALIIVLHYRLSLSDQISTLADGSISAGQIWDLTVSNQQLTQSDTAALFNTSIQLSRSLADDINNLADAVIVKMPRWKDAISTSAIQTRRWKDAVSVSLGISVSSITLNLADSITLSDALAHAREQRAAPVSDVSVGLWSTTPLWQKVDESAFNDADLITSATNPNNDTCEMSLAAMTDPASSVNHVLSYRLQKSAGGGRRIDLRAELRQGSTLLADWTTTDISNAVIAYNRTLTAAQADAITNYGDLRVQFVAQAFGTGTGRAARVTWTEFRCPK